MKSPIPLLVLSALAGLPQAHAYYGRHASEAMLEFKAEVDLPLDEKASEKALREGIDTQVQYLMGSFQATSSLKKFPFQGVLGEDHAIEILKKEAGSMPGRTWVTYRFKGKVVFRKEAFAKSATRSDLPIILPLSPDLIYAQSYDESSKQNPCTDEHYNSEEDFWYFWDSEKEGCELGNPSPFVYRTVGSLTQLENTSATYPEYDRLYDSAKGPLKIAVFVGYIDDVTGFRWPNRGDDGRKAYQAIAAYLRAQGYRSQLRKERFREDRLGREIGKGESIDFLEIYSKTIAGAATDGGELTVQIELLLADTEISSRDATFQNHFDKALEEADIVYYDGHSGLGGNLDLARIPGRVDFKRSRYQIFFFNGCSSYPYFNGAYFRAKQGTKNLEVVTSGLPTLTSTSLPNAQAFLETFVEGRRHSWQTIISSVDGSNGEAGTSLVGVSGDEDNLWQPDGR